MEIHEAADVASSSRQNEQNDLQRFEAGSIFKAPIPIRQANPRSFDPLVVSIGPYNRDKEVGLTINYRNKLLFVEDLLGEALRLHELVEEMMEMVPRARNCYSDGFEKLNDEEFAKMMVVDGCFIIRVLSFVRPEIPKDKLAALPMLKGERWLLPSIRLDLIKVENQIPFFILQTLQQSLSLRRLQTLPPVYDLALDFLRPLLTTSRTPEPESETLCFHLMSLLHIILLPKVPNYRIKVINNLGARSRGHSVVRACRIWSRGIILRVNEFLPMDVVYHNGILQAPCFTIDQNTETLLRNLVAYEHGNRLVEFRTTAYITVMDALVDTPNDVAFLRKKGMVSHVLGSDEEAAALINSLIIGIPHNEFECFLCELDGYIKPTSTRLIRSIMSFSEFIIFAVLHPNSFITAFLAILALYVGITQTVLAVVSLI